MLERGRPPRPPLATVVGAAHRDPRRTLNSAATGDGDIYDARARASQFAVSAATYCTTTPEIKSRILAGSGSCGNGDLSSAVDGREQIARAGDHLPRHGNRPAVGIEVEAVCELPASMDTGVRVDGAEEVPVSVVDG